MTRKTRSSVWIAIAGALAALPATAADITIHVGNVLPVGGVLRLGLYNEALYPDDDSKPIASADVPAMAPETVITLRNIPPGVYGILTFQDVNSNNRMDSNWIGLPLEPFGFSRDAKPFLSKPGFDEVKFTVTPGENVQTLHLQSMTSNSPADKARDALRARQRK